MQPTGEMPLFGHANAQTGLSHPAKKEGLEAVAVLTAGEAPAILEVQTEVSIDASSKRGKPQGLSRFLHGELLV